MPSHRFVSIRRGQVSMHGRRMGGAVVLLLDQSKTEPVRGGDIDGTSNKIVGIVTPQQAKPTVDGGKLLKHLNVGHAPIKSSTERIHFIF